MEQKKASSNDLIIRMIRCIISDDIPSFFSVIEQHANSLAHSSSIRANMLYLIKQKPIRLKQLNSLPPNIKNLIIQSDSKSENVFLNESINKLIDELILEWSNIPVYNYHNLKVRNKILLHGVTGNGKTTGSNIYNIFNQIKEPCVMFWDEIDSIGCKRGNDVKSAGHENDRMTNAMLVNLDKLTSDVVFIAATNRKDILDSAFIRRFDVQHEVTAPIKVEKERFAEQLISYYKLPIVSIGLDNLHSYSDIKNEIISIAREMVLKTIINNNIKPELN